MDNQEIQEKEYYYYTDYKTFGDILKNGTLRFKESTKSNDMVDTNLLFSEMKDIAEASSFGSDNLHTIINGVYSRNNYKSSRKSVVACFTAKKDSRLLWDAYTMNRPGRNSNRYNGVCLKINIDQLAIDMQSACEDEDYLQIMGVIYKKEARINYLKERLEKCKENYEELSKDTNQKQTLLDPMVIEYLPGRYIRLDFKKCFVNAISQFMQELELLAPFFKHEFWFEEEELRALLCKKQENYKKDDKGAYYYDVSISEDTIDKIILGPEFTDEDMRSLESTDNKIDIRIIDKELSIGTGVITSAS